MATEVETPHGAARVHLHAAAEPRAALVLGHGAGGGVTAPDLTVATEVALEEDISVALVEQPYRVAGRRSPAPADQLDAAWLAVVERLRAGELAGLPLIVGGRSLGARVACRTARGDRRGRRPLPRLPRPSARTPGEVAPVRARRRPGSGSRRSGEERPVRNASRRSRREVARVKGDHSLRTDRAAIADAMRSWLQDGPALRTRGR